MKSSALTVPFGLAAFLLCLLLVALSARVDARSQPEFAPGRLIVQLEPGKSAARITSDFASISLHPVKPLSRRLNLWLFTYDSPTGKSSDSHTQILDIVRAHQSVRLAQFDHLVSERSTLPDDPFFGYQWNLHNTGQSGGVPDADVDAPEAWDLATSGITAGGDPIVVAVIDAGCDLTHPDISYFRNLAEIPGNGVDDDTNGYIDDYDGWNAATSSGYVSSSDHGTHVAGIAAGRGDNSVGVCGVNWNVQVLPIVGSTVYESVAVEAYGYALEVRARYNESDGLAGAFVVVTNSSFGVDYGDPADFPVWCAMYDSLGAYGVLSAGAAPNISLDVDAEGDIPTTCPSDYLIAVTNTTSSDNRNPAAGYGDTCIDLGAPGTSVFSTLQGGSYGLKTGASMASPHVAGAVAFAYSVADADLIDYARLHPDSAALRIRQAVLDGVDTIPALTGLTATNGRLNLYRTALKVLEIPAGLIITHRPLPDTRDTVHPYLVSATIASDTLLIDDSLLVRYSVDGIPFVAALQAESEPDLYSALLPAQVPGSTIEYTVVAADWSGRIESIGPFSFHVVDYACALHPAALTRSGLVGDTLRASLWLVNTGLRLDEYTLTLAGLDWPTSLLDSAGGPAPAVVGPVAPDDSLRVMVQSIVLDSAYLAADTSTIRITSGNRLGLAGETSFISISEAAPVLLPFIETFPATIFDSSRWVRHEGAVIDSFALNTPSPPFSLHFDGNPIGSDTLISRAVPLDEQSAVLFSYAYQRTGDGDSPEPGDDVLVQYVDSAGNWRDLDRLSGDGLAMTTFARREHFLTADARHRLFRLRFHCQVSPGTGDDWFLDDIRLDLAAPVGLALMAVDSTVTEPAGDAAIHRLILRNRGASSDQFALAAVNSAGWAIALLDSSGTLSVSTTEILAPGDSISLQARVLIPTDAHYGTDALSLITAASVTDPAFSDTLPLVTTSLGVAGSIPWFEAFLYDTLSSVRWPQVCGATVDSSSVASPFRPYTLLLNGTDTVVSQPINLADVSEALLSLWYQVRTSEPPDTGACLCIEYEDPLHRWILLDSLTSAGMSPGALNLEGCSLSGTPLHDRFRLRLRSGPFGFDSTLWFVDNIRVDHPPLMTASPTDVLVALPANDTASAVVAIENPGAGELDYTIRVGPDSAFPWLSLSAFFGSVPPGGADSAFLTVSTVGLDTGVYLAYLYVSPSAPSLGESIVPVHLQVLPPAFLCGDVNGDSREPNVADLTYLVSFLFRDGPSPPVIAAADVNGSGGQPTISDLTYLVSYLFKGGAALLCLSR